MGPTQLEGRIANASEKEPRNAACARVKRDSVVGDHERRQIEVTSG